MLRYVHADQLTAFPKLRDSMFRDRARQFRDRLGWAVAVDGKGRERDDYDALNPLYVIWERPDGSHGGSMRFLPTLGRTMVNEHFAHVTGGVHISSPLIWECTRFCLAPDADRRVTPGLVLGAGAVMENFALEHFVGVFDPRMQRIYGLLGVEPEVIGTVGEGADRIGVGLWEFDESARPRMLAKAGVSRAECEAWWQASFSAAAHVLNPLVERVPEMLPA